MTCLPASVFLSLLIFICICVRLTLTVSDLHLDLFVLLSTRVSSRPSLSACSFVFCHTRCMPFPVSSPAFSAGPVRLLLTPAFCVCLHAACPSPIGLCVHCCSDYCKAEMEIHLDRLYPALKPVSHIKKNTQRMPEGTSSQIKVF